MRQQAVSVSLRPGAAYSPCELKSRVYAQESWIVMSSKVAHILGVVSRPESSGAVAHILGNIMANNTT